MRIAAKIAYLGWDFSGSQRQPSQRTVEGELLKALDFAKPEKFKAAGRTDRGVSALGMVFSFDCKTFSISRLNHHLPPDMCCHSWAKAPPEFNPRYSKERHYRYFLPKENASHPKKRPEANIPPPERGGSKKSRTTQHIEQSGLKMEKLDLSRMRAAAKLLEGTHDFSNFCRKSYRSPVRTIRKIAVSRTSIDFFAEGFLWEQVRRMSFFILQAGKSESAETTGAKPFSDPFLPRTPVPPLPPENLLLMNLRYPLKFQTDPKVLSEFKSRMGALAERKRVEQKILTSFISL